MEKITIVPSNLSGKGGTESVLHNVFTSKYIGENFHFIIFLPFGKRNLNWLNEDQNLDKMYALPFQKNDRSILARFVRLFLSTIFYCFCGSKVVVISNSRQIKIAKFIKKIFHKNYVVVSWVHFSLINSEHINPDFIKIADGHLAISTGVKQQLIELGVNPKTISMIYNPVLSSQDKVHRSNEKIKRLLYIGRLQFRSYKNFKFLMDGLKKLKIEWRLTVVGTGKDLDIIKKYATDIGIIEKIEFKGWKKKPWNSIGDTDALVLTSNSEGFGMVLAEAISRGIPVVSSNCLVGPKDIVKNGVNGELYKTNDMDDFLNSMEKVLTSDYSDIEKIKKSINYLYDENFDKRFVEAINKHIRN
ncbi:MULTISPECIES: glycosyltransferase [Bacilli]|uniref:glycosyltransferase n=1 Tax=Bacilli TaxID=91061 RepID=UPI0015A23F73|nr:glycosyltransferase [Heyndrickxia oleronia]MCI1764314.1 glycosyltransferase [Heyndrickxia oleronia]NVZ01652.1 glycosyltransferase [Pediococcus pentosaceus]